MERVIFLKQRVPKITDSQWAKLSVLFSDPSLGFSPRDIGNEAAMDYLTAQMLIMALAIEHVADNYLLVYHHCQDPPVARRRFEEGFQSVPWTCPACDEDVIDADVLRYEVSCKLHGPVDFL